MLPLLTVSMLFLHGPSTRHDQLERMFRLLIDLFQEFGVVPTWVFAHDPGAEEAPEETESFEAWTRKLVRSGFPPDVDSIVVGSGFPLLHDVTKVAGAFGTTDRGFSFGFDTWVSRFHSGLFTRVARRVWSLYEYEYGYALILPRSKRPWFYALGNARWSRQDPKERARGERWYRHIGRTEGKGSSPFLGMLRDVYPVNFLQQAHLSLEVGGLPLKTWIEARPDRGTLKPIHDRVWVWELWEKHVPAVRDNLHRAGLLVAGD